MCASEDCDNEAATSGLCRKHYMQQWELGKAYVTCEVQSCERGEFSRGWCRMHYKRWWKHGDPDYVRPRAKQSRTCARDGCNKPAATRTANYCSREHWKQRELSTSYGAVHTRIRKQRGSASQHTCTDCGEQANDWSYDHADANELTTEWYGNTVVYSADPDHYQPLCRPCHIRVDSPYEGSSLQKMNQWRKLGGKANRLLPDPMPRPVTQW